MNHFSNQLSRRWSPIDITLRICIIYIFYFYFLQSFFSLFTIFFIPKHHEERLYDPHGSVWFFFLTRENLSLNWLSHVQVNRVFYNTYLYTCVSVTYRFQFSSKTNLRKIIKLPSMIMLLRKIVLKYFTSLVMFLIHKNKQQISI